MANYYVFVSTWDDEDRDDFYLNTQLKDRKLSIGWGDLNPINKTEREIKRLIELFYPNFAGTNNPANGAKSLSTFAHLSPGDVVFVRGIAKIIDVVLITEKPYFDSTGHYKEDFYFKVSFVPLFESGRVVLETRNIPEPIYSDVLFAEGRSLVIRKLDENVAKTLFLSVFH